MTQKWFPLIWPFNPHDPQERLKFFLLSFAFAGIIGAYAILHPLKSSLFLHLIGVTALPWARIFTIFLILPSMFCYTKLIDKLGRHKTTCFFILFYTIILLISGYLIRQNFESQETLQNLTRHVFGWSFYLLLNFFSTFIAGTFWAYTNSMHTPESAKKQYGYIVAIGRSVGIITSLCASFFLDCFHLEHHAISWIIFSTAGLLVSSYICLMLLQKKLPKPYLQGYVDTHQPQKTTERTRKPATTLEGLKLLLTNTYVRGIFGLICSFELIYIILDYQLQLLVSAQAGHSITSMSKIFLYNTAMVQGLTLILALFTTAPLLRFLGVKYCLTLVPCFIICCISAFLYHQTLTMLIIITVIIHALNYGFNAPTRQIVLIPTTEEIQFKARAWMDSCGKTTSKFSGSALGLLFHNTGPEKSLLLNSWAALTIGFVWIFIANFIGKIYEETIQTGSLIGNNRGKI